MARSIPAAAARITLSAMVMSLLLVLNAWIAIASSPTGTIVPVSTLLPITLPYWQSVRWMPSCCVHPGAEVVPEITRQFETVKLVTACK